MGAVAKPTVVAAVVGSAGAGRAVDVLLEIAEDQGADDAVRVSAAGAVLDAADRVTWEEAG
jgi:hypothetical protein